MEQTQNTIALMTTMIEMIADAERRTEEAEIEKKEKEEKEL